MSILNIGLVGCGRISDRHVMSIKKLTGVNLIAVCDIEKEKAKQIATDDMIVYKDYQKMLMNKDIDIISICTPSGLHTEMGIAALNEGKHVLCEKPMSMNVIDADRMIAAATEAGKKLGVVMQNRFNKPIQSLKKLIQEGNLGKILLGNATVRWYRPQSYYEDGWHGTIEMDGGILMNQAIHFVDALTWLIGDTVKNVYVKSATLAHEIEMADTALGILEFNGGALAHIEASTITFPKNLEGSVSIFGEKGSVKIGGTALNKIVTWRVGNKNEKDILKNQDDKDPQSIYGHSHSLVYDNFINSIINKTPLLVDGHEGQKSVRLVKSMQASAKRNQTIYL